MDSEASMAAGRILTGIALLAALAAAPAFADEGQRRERSDRRGQQSGDGRDGPRARGRDNQAAQSRAVERQNDADRQRDVQRRDESRRGVDAQRQVEVQRQFDGRRDIRDASTPARVMRTGAATVRARSSCRGTSVPES